MLELCQIIDEYGAQFNEDGTQKIIYFGELFNVSFIFKHLNVIKYVKF